MGLAGFVEYAVGGLVAGVAREVVVPNGVDFKVELVVELAGLVAELLAESACLLIVGPKGVDLLVGLVDEGAGLVLEG